MSTEISKNQDRLNLVLVASLLSAFLGLSDYGHSSHHGFEQWEVVLWPAGIGMFLVSKFIVRTSWSCAAGIAVNMYVWPLLTFGAFWGAKDLLHANSMIAALIAALPAAVLVWAVYSFVAQAIQAIRKSPSST
jgi:hypothetical protein